MLPSKLVVKVNKYCSGPVAFKYVQSEYAVKIPIARA